MQKLITLGENMQYSPGIVRTSIGKIIMLPHKGHEHSMMKVHALILCKEAIMPEYQLEIKQIVDYPRCRIYRQFIRTLMEDQNIRTSGGFWSFLLYCS